MFRRMIVIAAGVFASQPAYADSCKPGTSGWDIIGGIIEAIGSSSSSSSSSPASSPSSGGAVAERACVDADGNIVECAHGKGTDTPISIEFGTVLRSSMSPLGVETGTVEHDGEAFSYRATGQQARIERAAVAQLRITTPVAYGLYAGGELEGGVYRSSSAVEMTSGGTHGTPEISGGTMAATYGGNAIAGIGTKLGDVSFGVEAAAGIRAVSYSFHSSYVACETNDTVTVAMPVLEARARAAVAVTPAVDVGGMYGKSVIDRSWLGGIYVGWHSR